MRILIRTVAIEYLTHIRHTVCACGSLCVYMHKLYIVDDARESREYESQHTIVFHPNGASSAATSNRAEVLCCVGPAGCSCAAVVVRAGLGTWPCAVVLVLIIGINPSTRAQIHVTSG